MIPAVSTIRVNYSYIVGCTTFNLWKAVNEVRRENETCTGSIYEDVLLTFKETVLGSLLYELTAGLFGATVLEQGSIKQQGVVDITKEIAVNDFWQLVSQTVPDNVMEKLIKDTHHLLGDDGIYCSALKAVVDRWVALMKETVFRELEIGTCEPIHESYVNDAGDHATLYSINDGVYVCTDLSSKLKKYGSPAEARKDLWGRGYYKEEKKI